MRFIDLKVISSDIVYVKGLGLNPVPITSGSVNDIQIRFEFSSHWNDFALKTAVFTGSGETKSVIIENDTAIIPWECISLPGGEIRVGVVGTTTDDENKNDFRIFTSEEICIGTVVMGADIGALPSEEPTPTLAQQLLLKFDWVEKNEEDRIVGENKRLSSEETRNANENERKTNEEKRQQDELVRIQNEITREQNEIGRINDFSEFDARLTLLESLSNVGNDNSLTPGNLVAFDNDGKLCDSGISVDDVDDIHLHLNEHTNESADNTNGAHGMRVKDGALQTKTNGVWKNVRHFDTSVDPIFENNSWEKIAEVARFDDPSKYWNVGQYKNVELASGECQIVYTKKEIEFDEEKIMKFFRHTEGNYKIYYKQKDGNIYPVYVYPSGREENDTINYTQFPVGGIEDLGKESVFSIKRIIKQYPVQIIGFNHDNVSDIISYGKAKAGMTLMLGCNRSVYGNKPSVYDANIPKCSVEWYDNHILSPNRILPDGSLTEEGTNWNNGGFRHFMTEYFEDNMPDVIRNNVVAVNKLTSNSFNAKNIYRDMQVNQEKYFLLSEYEIYGEQLRTKAIEGEQYDLFKLPFSKIIMTPELYDATQGKVSDKYANSRLWLRSVMSKYTDQFIPSTSYFDPMYNCALNSDYTNGVNPRTNSLLMSYNTQTGNFDYHTGGASTNSVAAYIVPCFCL